MQIIVRNHAGSLSRPARNASHSMDSESCDSSGGGSSSESSCSSGDTDDSDSHSGDEDDDEDDTGDDYGTSTSGGNGEDEDEGMFAGFGALSRAGGAFPLKRYVHPAREHLGRRCKQAGNMYASTEEEEEGDKTTDSTTASMTTTTSTDDLDKYSDPAYMALEDGLVQFIVMRYMWSKYDVVSPQLAALRGLPSTYKCDAACQTDSSSTTTSIYAASGGSGGCDLYATAVSHNDAMDIDGITTTSNTSADSSYMHPSASAIDELRKCLSPADLYGPQYIGTTCTSSFAQTTDAFTSTAASTAYFTVAQAAVDNDSNTIRNSSSSRSGGGIVGLDSSMWV